MWTTRKTEVPAVLLMLEADHQHWDASTAQSDGREGENAFAGELHCCFKEKYHPHSS